MSEVTIKNPNEIIANIVLSGDISNLCPDEKVKYYNMFCESLGLNPVTKPFQILKLSGKEILYATKDASEQLRKLNGISIVNMEIKTVNDIYIVTVKVKDKSGREDISTGAINIKGLIGDSLANAMMKTETKAKRRATLSISGLGALDETEIETIPGPKEIKDVTERQPETNPAQRNIEDVNKIFGKPPIEKKLDILFKEFFDYVGKNKDILSEYEMKQAVILFNLHKQGMVDYDKLNNFFILLKKSVDGMDKTIDEMFPEEPEKVEFPEDDDIAF